MTDKKGSVWDRPITQEERDLVNKTRRDKRYAGENVLLFEGRIVGHCTSQYEFGDILYEYRGKRAFALYVPGKNMPMLHII